MSDDEIPAPDQLEGACHPRHTENLFGHAEAEADFLTAFNGQRLHHAWMLTGPKGIGKSTLAWRIARFVLAQSEEGGMFDEPNSETLDIPSDHPVAKRVSALGEPRLYLARRPWDEKTKKLKQNITVDEIRKLKSFFALSAADAGWRVAIIDTADEMNTSAANALLKLLEEPPKKVLILLVSHQPSRLLPTIRSRCRAVRCHPLKRDDLQNALAQAEFSVGAETTQVSILANGSVGSSIELLSSEGVNIYQSIVNLASKAPNMDREGILKLSNACVGKNAEDRYVLTIRLFSQFLQRLAKFGAIQPADFQEAASGEARAMSSLAPSAHMGRKWAELMQDLSARTTHAKAVNLDPSSVILDMFLKFEETARN